MNPYIISLPCDVSASNIDHCNVAVRFGERPKARLADLWITSLGRHVRAVFAGPRFPALARRIEQHVGFDIHVGEASITGYPVRNSVVNLQDPFVELSPRDAVYRAISFDKGRLELFRQGRAPAYASLLYLRAPAYASLLYLRRVAERVNGHPPPSLFGRSAASIYWNPCITNVTNSSGRMFISHFRQLVGRDGPLVEKHSQNCDSPLAGARS